MKRLSVVIAIIFITLFALTACSTDILDKKVVSIEVESFDAYDLYQGDNLNLSQAKLRVSYDNGEVAFIPITQDMISNFDKNVIGKQKVTVTYEGLEQKIDINIKDIQIISIEIERVPEDFSVIQGNDLDVKGISLRINYQNKYSILEKIDISYVSGYSKQMEPGVYDITITFSGYTATTKLTVLSKAITSISVSKKPNDVQYFLNEKLDPSGLQITILYDNKSTAVVAYSDRTAEDFKFDYDLSTALPASPITVTYLGSYKAVFTVVVSAPKCINLEFDSDATITNPDGSVTRAKYPVSKGFSLNGGAAVTSQLNQMIQGDTIDWSTGVAYLTYDDGSHEFVNLSDNSINVAIRDVNQKETDAKFMVFNDVSNYTLYVKYRNMAKATPLYVEVRAREAHQLLLSNEEEITAKTYVHGATIVPDLIKYNILYDNGTYKFPKDNTKEWGNVTVEMLSSVTSLVCYYNEATGGIQPITFITEGVEITINAKVIPLEALSVTITAPTQTNVIEGSVIINLAGGAIHVVYNNTNTADLLITQEMLTIYKGNSTSGEPVAPGTALEIGKYTVLVTYLQKTVEFNVNVVSNNDFVVGLEVANVPAKVPEFFDVAAFTNAAVQAGISLKATYRNGNTEYVMASDAELFQFDDFKVGYQNVQYRYKGCVTNYPIIITGIQVNRIEVVKDSVTALKTNYNLGESIDYKGLIIEKFFTDGTSSQVTVFDSADWKFIAPNMNKIGDYQVTVMFGSMKTTYAIHITVGEVEEIKFERNQDGLEEGYLIITLGEDINLTGLVIKVKYAGTNVFVSIPLENNNVKYDKNFNQLGKRELSIEFGNKFTTMGINVVIRTLERISIHKVPTINVYVNNQKLNLEGGYINRFFSDGTTDIIPMIGHVDTNYDPDFFDNNATDEYIKVQSVTVKYGGKEAQMEITTHKKTTIQGIVTYEDTVSFYGNVKTPKIVVNLPNNIFVAPQYTVEYLVDGAWTNARPSLPGKYGIKIIVIGNEYFSSSESVDETLTIIPKILLITAVRKEKTYGTADPTLEYITEGDVIVDGKIIANTELVYNNGVQDKIDIKLVREKGEDVRLNASGSPLGYKISMEVDSTLAQNDRYILDFTAAELTINKAIISEKISFVGDKNLVSDGVNKVITATYVRGGNTFYIIAKDIIYTDESGNVLDKAPWKPGKYTATINSNNYTIVGDSNPNSVEFTIKEA